MMRRAAIAIAWLRQWGVIAVALCCAASGMTAAQAAASLQVIYPPAESAADDRSDYPHALLDLALRESGFTYELRQYTTRLPQARALAMLASGKELSIYWSMTSRQREADLLPVRIPIDKGLLGWRLLLIRAADQPRFSAITTLDQLKRVPMGQGHDWPDTDILLANGFAVQGIPSYELLFAMLQKGRIDCVPRAIGEIRDEAGLHEADGLTIESSLALHYPTAEYFFVHRDNVLLAEALQRGLIAAIHDGSFEKLFQLYHGQQIRSAHFERRRLFEVPNPLLPEGTPLQTPPYWFTPH